VNGFKLSPLVGQWMAEFVLTGQKPADMQRLSFERFTNGQEIRPNYNSGVLA
jgi:glycine/D-amino acid oxidase-like deaminating enzyme